MAVQYSETQAIQVASELTRLDLDGWTYRPEPVIPEEVTVVDIHLAVVAVYDESGDFVDYLNMRLIPTELERMVPLKVTVTEEYRFCGLCREQSRFDGTLCDTCKI